MPPKLQTARMILRVPVEADFDAGWAEFHGDADSMRFLGGPMPRGPAWRMLATCIGMWSLRGYGPFSAIEKATGRWLGRVGPWNPEGWPAPEVGWLFHRSAWGQGFATEAAKSCLAYVFDDLGWPRVGHMIRPDNAASKRVAERVGSAFISEVRLPPPMDMTGPAEMWGQSAEAWRVTSSGPAA